jgi:diaminopimelate decarboxylase
MPSTAKRSAADETGGLAVWGAHLDADGNLAVDGVSSLALADRFGTPLHVVNAGRFADGARAFVQAFASRYPGAVEVYLAAKTNAVRGVLELARGSGLGVEIFSPFELRLALGAGFRGDRIIVNGPAKTAAFLRECIDAEVKLIVVDSLDELEDLAEAASDAGRAVQVLLRVNVDYVPRGMNPGTATGSRRSVFGMDWRGEEILQAARMCATGLYLEFRGLHMHIGSGIRHADDYARACDRLCETAALVERTAKMPIEYLDVGGGFGSPTVREFSTLEFLRYHALHQLPRPPRTQGAGTFAAFADAIAGAIARGCRRHGLQLPVLVLEPGRCLSGPSQMLLLRVVRTKARRGLRPWIVTDGGQMTVNFPTFYEYHAMFCCRQPFRPPAPPVDVIGSGCHAADVVSRDRRLPEMLEGDVLAIMDAGAYFLSFEGNFGFPRAAIVAVAEGAPLLLRRRETCDDMLARDLLGLEART